MANTCSSDRKPKSFREYIRTREFIMTLVFVGVGGIAGYLYYHFVGCTSGTCAITSNPYASVAMGGFLGFFLINRPCAC